MQNLPPRFARDLETAIVWFRDAAEKLAEIENHLDSSRELRELASDARTDIKAGLYLFKEVRSLSQVLENGQAQTEEAKETIR